MQIIGRTDLAANKRVLLSTIVIGNARLSTFGLAVVANLSDFLVDCVAFRGAGEGEEVAAPRVPWEGNANK